MLDLVALSSKGGSFVCWSVDVERRQEEEARERREDG